MRRALLSSCCCLAGCGAAESRRPGRRPRQPIAPSVKQIAGTDTQAQAVADAAAGVPVDGHLRRRAGAAAASRTSIARSRAIATTARARRRRWPPASTRSPRALKCRRPRRRAARVGAGLRALPARSARPTARSGISTPRSPTSAMRLERGLWTGESLRALQARGGAARARRAASCGGSVRRIEITPLDYADPRARDPRGRPARSCSAASPRRAAARACCATAASLEATEAVVGTLRTVLAARGALAPVGDRAAARCDASSSRDPAKLTAARWPRSGRAQPQRAPAPQRAARRRAGAARAASRTRSRRQLPPRRSRSCGREAQSPPLPDSLRARARRRRGGRVGSPQPPTRPAHAAAGPAGGALPVRRAAPGGRADTSRATRWCSPRWTRSRPTATSARSKACAALSARRARADAGLARCRSARSRTSRRWTPARSGSGDRARRADGDDRLRRTRCSTSATGSAAPSKLTRMTPFDGDRLDAGAHPRRRRRSMLSAHNMDTAVARAARAAAPDPRRSSRCAGGSTASRAPTAGPSHASARAATCSASATAPANPDTADDALMRQPRAGTPDGRHLPGACG